MTFQSMCRALCAIVLLGGCTSEADTVGRHDTSHARTFEPVPDTVTENVLLAAANAPGEPNDEAAEDAPSGDQEPADPPAEPEQSADTPDVSDTGAPIEEPAAPLNPQPRFMGVKGKPRGYGEEVYRLVNQQDEIVSVLKNGATVIAKRVPSPVLAVRGYVYTGGVYEGPWLGGGLSHLLEHLVAGGTNDRRTEAENRNLLQELGNNSNAYTTTDHTAYFVNTTPDRLDRAVDLLTGWMLTATITKEEYAREYEVVQRELEMGKGEPDRQLYYLSNFNRYRVSPARVPVIGYQEVIQGLSRDDVYRYYKLTYQPNNMVFSIAGNADPEKMLAAFRKHVDAATPGREFSRDLPAEPPVLGPRSVVATFPKLGQAKLQIGFPTIRLDHPDLYALDLLAEVLGEGDSSLLVEELRDNRKLVSAVGVTSDTPSYVDGTFEVSMELDANRISAATDAALQVLEKIKDEPIDPKRIERAKTLVKAARVKRLQTSEEIASTLATDYMSTGDPHFTDRYTQRIGQVTAAQIQAVARKYFDRGKLLTTLLLPAEFVGAKGLPAAEDVIRAAAPTARPVEDKPASAVTRFELENGTIVLLKRISTSPLVVMNMYSLGGLTAEDAKTNGLGNLTMQMLLRGTKNRTAQQIAEAFANIGGDIDTACGNNSWYWNATCLAADFDTALAAYADVVNNPTFPEDELEPMKRRVIAAIQGQDADWTSQAFRYFKQQYFGPMESPYQFVTIGTEENVARFTPADLRKWYENRVLKGRRVLAVYGDIEPADVKEKINKALGGLPAPARGGHEGPPGVRDGPPKSTPDTAGGGGGGGGAAAGKPAMEVERVEVQQTQQPLAGVIIGFKADPVIGHPIISPIIVADTMTSGYGYPTGYLHEILRGRGQVYVVHGQNQPGRSEQMPGTFFVYAGCEPKNVNAVVDTILENIARLQGKPKEINVDWFKRSKDLAIVSEALENETPAQQATAAALDELYGLGYDYHERFADRIRAVELKDVQAMARARLNKCVVTISTPAPDAVKVKPGRREYESFPEVDLTPKGVEHAVPGQ